MITDLSRVNCLKSNRRRDAWLGVAIYISKDRGRHQFLPSSGLPVSFDHSTLPTRY